LYYYQVVQRRMKRIVVTISLPEELLDRIDRARRESGSSRSEYMRRAAVGVLNSTVESDVARYVRGYRDRPETSEEVETARRGAATILAVEPWE
jgi:metal-responsive CopG/Arc/MetJ family transcriptional regulator